MIFGRGSKSDPHRKDRRRAADSLLTAARSQPSDERAGLDQMFRILAYEEWVLNGRPEGGLRQAPPTFCGPGEVIWPDDLQYAIVHTLSYVAQSLDFVPWSEIVLSLARRATVRDPRGATELIAVVGAARERFEAQYGHARAGLNDASLADEPEAGLRRALNAYAAMYEIDMSLWLLGVLAKADQTGQIDPGYLGGPDGKTAQGAMLNEIVGLLSGTPLEFPFEMTYDPALRNAIGHNDVAISEAAEGLEVSDRKSGRTWSGTEVHGRLLMADFMVQAVALAADLDLSGRRPPSTDSGVLSFTCHLMDHGIPLVVVSQLDCFHRLDSVGAWVDAADLEIKIDGKLTTEMRLTDRARIPTRVPVDSQFVSAVQSSGWVEVQRLALAPNLGHQLPVVELMSAESYEIVRPADRHYVRARVTDAVADTMEDGAA